MRKQQAAPDHPGADDEVAAARAQLECNAAVSRATAQLIASLVEVQNGVTNLFMLLSRGDGDAAVRAMAEFQSAAERLASLQMEYAVALQRVGDALTQGVGARSRLN